jgi:RNA polymerase sigma-70 factor (ECF subfamily)
LWLSVSADRRPDYVDAEAVWRDMHAPLLGFITSRVGDRDSAEDILQDVMLRIHRHAGDLPRASAVTAWIHEIVRNAITDHYRRAVVRRERPAGSHIDVEIHSDPPISAVPETDSGGLRTELAACLEPLLAQLPPIYRDALRLTELDGLTRAQAAAQTGLTTSGMKTRVQRARTQLKDLFMRCCHIELDRRGGIIDYQPNNDSCDCRPSASTRPVSGGHGAHQLTK